MPLFNKTAFEAQQECLSRSKKLKLYLFFCSLIRIFVTMKHLLTIFALLLTLCCCTSEGEKTRMRAGLDSLNERSRNYETLAVAEVQPYVEFFDKHGTANDRMLAHYLLGLAYLDHGETPMALQCYQDAIDCADTTSVNCDFCQLSRVYGQMSGIFYYQGLYRNMLFHLNKSIKLAWKGRDSLLALRYYEQKFLAFKGLGRMDSAIMVLQHVAQEYDRHGKTANSAISLGLSIKPLIDKGDFQTAKHNIDQYESLSGRFDSQGNIEAGREIYYKSKGLYYLYTNVLDSAEYYFRKEMREGKDFNNQNAAATGLAELYQRLHQPDSVAKYSLYAYAMSDSLYSQRTTKEVERMQAMYDYTRHQKTAMQEKERAAKEKAKRQFSIAMLLLLAIVASFIIYRMYEEKKKKQAQYMRNLEELEQTHSEVLQLRAHAEEYEELIAIKEKLLDEQNEKLQEQRKKSLQDHVATDKHIKESDIYQCLQKKQYGQKLTVQELRDCRKLVLETLPEFNNLLLSKQYKISVKDFNVCMLFRLGFRSKEISNMLDITQGRVSQICSKLLRDVFKKDKGGAVELIEILCELY